MGRLANPNSPSRIAKAEREARRMKVESGEIQATERRGRPAGSTSKNKNKVEDRVAFRVSAVTNNKGEGAVPFDRQHLTATSWAASEETIAAWYAKGEIPICQP